jgi:hypothetical protein
MIYEAEVTFHNLRALVFVPGESGIEEEVKYKMLVAPDRDKIVFINSPATPICRIYLAPCRVTAEEGTCKLTHFMQNGNNNEGYEIVVATIISSK